MKTHLMGVFLNLILPIFFMVAFCFIIMYAITPSPVSTNSEFEVNGVTYHGQGKLLDNTYRIITTDGETVYVPLTSVIKKRDKR